MASFSASHLAPFSDGADALGVRLARREEAALAEVYAVYAPAVRSYLRRYVGPDEAEDVLQGTFLDLWRSAGRYQPRQRLGAWLFTIAHHRAVDALRRRRTPSLDLEALRALPGEDGRVIAERHAQAAEVRAALGRLPEHERVVLELAYYGDLSQREIAHRLEVPIGTVKARASRGIGHLRDLIGPTQPDSVSGNSISGNRRGAAPRSTEQRPGPRPPRGRRST